MAHRTRLKYTDEMKSYMWDRYQQSDSAETFFGYMRRVLITMGYTLVLLSQLELSK